MSDLLTFKSLLQDISFSVVASRAHRFVSVSRDVDMQFFVLRGIVVHFCPLPVLDAAFASNDDLGSSFLLKLFLSVSSRPQN